MRQLEVELEDEEELVKSIYDFTSGHLNVVQRLCQQLVERLNRKQTRRITLDDIDAVVSDLDFLRRDFLETFWERATALERLICLVIAQSENSLSLTSVHQALLQRDISVNIEQMEGALERLIDLRSILHSTSSGYDFAVAAEPNQLA